MKAVSCGTIRWVLLLSLCLGCRRRPGPGPMRFELQVQPDVVEIGAFFNGQEVKISGKIPQGAQAVIEISGPATVEHLMRKGRRGGLWMNVGEMEVQGAPSLYLASSTSPPLLKEPPAGAVWGYPALKQQIKFAGEVEPEEREYFWTSFFSSRKVKRSTPFSPEPLR